MESSVEIRFSLVLRGSFYPLHRGHTNLFLAAKQYISGLEWSSDTKISFDKFYLSPISTRSLSRKHNNCMIDEEEVIENLHQTAQELDGGSRQIVVLPHYHLHAVPSSKIISILVRSQYENSKQSGVIHKLVQISGVDSMVKAIVKSNNRIDKRHPLLRDLDLILVVDSRGVPDDNVQVVSEFRHVAHVKDCLSGSGSADLLPRSSTMQRFIMADTYYPKEDFEHLSSRFDVRWLIDTGVNLGHGRQGLVRLMMLGGHAYVAVKVIRLAKKNRFKEEAMVWRHLAKNCPDAIPRLYETCVMGDYGLIITDVGVPLTHIFPALKPNREEGHDSKFIPKGYESLFDQFKTSSEMTGSHSLPLAHPFDELLQGLDSDEVKRNISQSLQEKVLPGLDS